MHPITGTTYLRLRPVELSRGHTVKAAMRPFHIIEFYVFCYHLLCLRNILEDISVKAFISELAVEALQVAVLPGAGLFNKFMAYTLLLQELLEGQAPELSALIGSDDSGYSKKTDTFFEDLDGNSGRDTEVNINAGAEATEDILNSYEFYESAACKTVKEEIHGPDMIWISRLGQWSPGHGNSFVFTRFLPLQIKTFVDSVDFFVIDADTLPVHGKMDPSVAVESVFEGDLLDHFGNGDVLLILQRVVIQGTGRDTEEETCSFHFNALFYHFSGYHSPFMNGQKFFFRISLRTCISSSFSARIRLRRRFSSSRTLRRLASSEDRPLNLCFHLSNVLLPIEYLRQISATVLPGRSASARIWIILSTGYFVVFIIRSPFQDYTFRTFVIPENGEQGSCRIIYPE